MEGAESKHFVFRPVNYVNADEATDLVQRAARHFVPEFYEGLEQQVQHCELVGECFVEEYCEHVGHHLVGDYYRHTLKASRRQLELQETYTMGLSNYSLISGDESLDQSSSISKLRSWPKIAGDSVRFSPLARSSPSCSLCRQSQALSLSSSQNPRKHSPHRNGYLAQRTSTFGI